MKVKVDLSPGQTTEQAEEELYKALNFQRTGEIHGDEFLDPAMQSTSQFIVEEHEKILVDSMEEIFRLLEKENSDGNI